MDKYRSFSVTHEGAKHEAGVPCQDASAHNDELENTALAVVADGHGSSRCFRSDIGSAKAVDVAQKTVERFIINVTDVITDPEDFRAELNGIVKQIINKWFAAVMKNEETNPLQNDSRIEGITEKYKDRYINDIDYRCHAYGTTLTVAAMGKDYWFGFQVGDGKCVVLYEDGSWDTPIPWDDRCSFNTTTSICDDDSLSGFRYWFGISDGTGGYTEYGYGIEGQAKDYPPIKKTSRPLAIFIGSDGVEDSYPRVDNDKYVVNFYRNRVICLAERGFDSFNEEIDGFAKRFADRESTDDVSIAGIIGDFSNKSDMIAQMKQESEIHEATELAAVKRRDADEKRDALTAVESRTNTVTANQRQLEGKVSSIEQEIADLKTKGKSYESALIKGESEVAASDREMFENKSKIDKLGAECSSLSKDEQLIASSVSRAENLVVMAQKEWKKSKDNRLSKQEALVKADEKYKKQLKKLAAINSATQSIADKSNGTVNVNVQNQPADAGTGFVDAIKQAFVPDIETLTQNLDNAKKELKTAQSQEVIAKQRYDQKRSELIPLQQRLASVQDKVRQVEYELKQAEQAYSNAEILNRNQRAAVAQCRDNIADIERQIIAKQVEVDKFQAELKTLVEQTKKQTDILAEIKEAWEKSDAEAKKYEDITQKK